MRKLYMKKYKTQSLKNKNSMNENNNINLWTTEVNNVKKHMDNDFLYYIWKNYSFPNVKLDGEEVKLDSNINVYEACFITLLIDIFVKKYKPIMNDNTLNIMEIGMAYGTSTLTIINKLLLCKYKINYDVIDMSQSTHWKNIGMINVTNFIEHTTKIKKIKNKINFNLFEDSSTIIVPKFRKHYDISFIDGSHDKDIVIQDLINTHKILKIGGIIIVDDILHNGVKEAILKFYNPQIYKIVYINNKLDDYNISTYLYDKNRIKRDILNPNSMLCFQKITNNHIEM